LQDCPPRLGRGGKSSDDERLEEHDCHDKKMAMTFRIDLDLRDVICLVLRHESYSWLVTLDLAECEATSS